MEQDFKTNVIQLRRVAKNWRQRAWLGVGLAMFSSFGLMLCWNFQANWFWWLLCGLAVMSALIEVFADFNAAYDTKKRIEQMETESATH